jgi:hypothetical protein
MASKGAILWTVAELRGVIKVFAFNPDSFAVCTTTAGERLAIQKAYCPADGLDTKSQGAKPMIAQKQLGHWGIAERITCGSRNMEIRTRASGISAKRVRVKSGMKAKMDIFCGLTTTAPILDQMVTSINIDKSWLKCLGGLCAKARTFITETAIEKTTDLRIWNFGFQVNPLGSVFKMLPDGRLNCSLRANLNPL